MSYVLRSARYLAADCLRQVVQPGDTVIDATLATVTIPACWLNWWVKTAG